MTKYFEILKFNLKTKLNFKVDFLFSIFGFTLHMFVFNELWDYILKDKTILGYTKSDLIWYIIFAEVIMYAFHKNYKAISEMIKSGEVANFLVKPIDFVKYVIATEASCLIPIVINLISGVIIGICMAGPIEVSALQVVALFIHLIFSSIICILLQAFIGILAIITEENESFYMVISKLMLILCFTPLELFPSIVQKILKVLPTTYAIYPTAKTLIHFDIMQSTIFIIIQSISILFMYGMIRLVYMKGVKNINVNGG